MIVRAAAASDVGAMAGVAAASYGEAFAAILDSDALATRTAEFFAQRFEREWIAMWVAEEAGRILGFLELRRNHIDMLFVAPAAQGRGAGRALLAIAEANGATTLECFRDNAGARAFYERQGWRLARSYAREFGGRPHEFVWYEKPPRG